MEDAYLAGKEDPYVVLEDGPPLDVSTAHLGLFIRAGSNYFTKTAFANLLLYDDLFKTLKVKPGDFFLGAGDWARIPRFITNA